jgi:phage FluMu protein Com
MANIRPMEFAEVTCPTCFEVFEVAVPSPDEMPTEVDYDCEICCRPMTIVFTREAVWAKGLGE